MKIFFFLSILITICDNKIQTSSYAHVLNHLMKIEFFFSLKILKKVRY